MSSKHRDFAKPHRQSHVDEVLTNDLRPNPHNPRMLFDRVDLITLKDSIEKVGILVPLTVYKGEKDKKYTILDGQRRWICAQEINLKKVPINVVAEPTTAQNIVTMFQIHKLRKDWELMPTALKLDVLMDELQETRDKQLAELTGLDIASVVRCKKLLWYSEKFQQMMLFAEPEDRVKADFFIELYPIVNDKDVKRAEWFKRDYFIKKMLYKYQHGLSGIKAITDFRKIKQHISASAKNKTTVKLLRRLHEFLENDKLTIDHLEISSAAAHMQARKLIKSASTLFKNLEAIEADEFYGEEDLWIQLEKLQKLIQKKLLQADRRPQR